MTPTNKTENRTHTVSFAELRWRDGKQNKQEYYFRHVENTKRRKKRFRILDSEWREKKSMKIEPDSRKLNDSSNKKRPQMSDLEKPLNEISIKITRIPGTPIWMSYIDLKYAYGQLNLSEKTCRQCVFSITGGNVNGYYSFEKRFCGLSNIATILKKNRRNTEISNSRVTRRYSNNNKGGERKSPYNIFKNTWEPSRSRTQSEWKNIDHRNKVIPRSNGISFKISPPTFGKNQLSKTVKKRSGTGTKEKNRVKLK